MSDLIKHPSHYVEGRKYEPKDVIRDWGLGFNLGSAVKYLSRAGRKDDIIRDLKKAQEFIQFEIDAIEAERKAERKDAVDAMRYVKVIPHAKDVEELRVRLEEGIIFPSLINFLDDLN